MASEVPCSSSIGLNNILDDVLVEIFLHLPQHRWETMPNYSSKQEHHYPLPAYRKRLPWALNHVCRRWREIARSTPRLWSYLPSIDLSKSVPYLEEYLALAGTATPLSVHICQTNDNPNPDPLSLLFDRVEQWQEVMIFFHSPDLPDFTPLRSYFKMLRIIHIMHNHADFPLDLFSDAPVLEELTYLIPGPHPVLPSSLKKYQGYSTHPMDAIDLLSKAPQLVTVRFSRSHSGYGWPHDTDFPSIVMPSLESLSLHNCQDGPEGPFLRALTLPNLQNLALNLSASSRNLQYAHIIQMIQRSGASLRTLTMEACGEGYPTITQLQDVLASTPDLEFFRWYSHSQRDETPYLAIIRDPTVLPRLKTLIYDDWMSSELYFDRSLLLEIVNTRRANGSHPAGCLTYLCLRKPDIHEDDQDALTGWSPRQDPHYSRLVGIKEQLGNLFVIPVHERTPENINTIYENLQYIIGEYNNFKTEAILVSEIHILLSQLVLRGTSHPPVAHRIESDWIPKVQPILETWKERTREYVKPSRWFRFYRNIYWVTDNQADVYAMFWETEPTPDPWFHFRRRSMPMKFVDPIIPYNWMPDWEHAELPHSTYRPALAEDETQTDDEQDLSNHWSDC